MLAVEIVRTNGATQGLPVLSAAMSTTPGMTAAAHVAATFSSIATLDGNLEMSPA